MVSNKRTGRARLPLIAKGIYMTDLSESFDRIINQCDSARHEAQHTPLTGTRKKYCQALSRTVEDLVKEIRMQMSSSLE